MISLQHAHSGPMPFLLRSPCCEYYLYFLIQILPIFQVLAQASSPPQNFLYILLEKIIVLTLFFLSPWHIWPLTGASVLIVAPWLQYDCRGASCPNQVPHRKKKYKGQKRHLSQLSQPHLKSSPRNFPGGAVVKNPPANAGDMGLSHGPGRSHMPQNN